MKTLCVIMFLILFIVRVSFLYYAYHCFNKNTKSLLQHYGVSEVKLNFKQFRDYYLVSKKRFRINQDSILFKSDFSKSPKYHQDIVITLSFINFIKVFFFLGEENELEKLKITNEEIQSDNQAYIDLLNTVQNDINKLKKQSEEEIEKAKNVMEKVSENINRSNPLEKINLKL